MRRRASICRRQILAEGLPPAGNGKTLPPPPIEKARDLGVPIRDYKKTKIILMGTPASEYRKESSNFFELSLCVEFIFAKENLFKLCIDYEKSI